MNTIIQKIDLEHVTLQAVREAANIIRAGGLVAFPTETVYGLGANAKDALAAKKIYQAKGRPSDNPLIVHIAALESLSTVAKNYGDAVFALAEKFWPGPLTLILQKQEQIPYSTTGGLDTVAVRMPKNEIALKLIEASGCCIAAPSANISGKPSPTTMEHVKKDLFGKIDCILDGGSVGIGLESTIVDMTEKIPVILRPGYVTKEQLEMVLGSVSYDPALFLTEQRPKAPGMKYRHYAPEGNLIIVQGDAKRVIQRINLESAEKVRLGKRVGIIATQENRQQYLYGTVKVIGRQEDQGEIGRNLFSILREFDELGTDYIYTESFSEEGFGQAIMNRLKKAAANVVYDV